MESSPLQDVGCFMLRFSKVVQNYNNEILDVSWGFFTPGKILLLLSRPVIIAGVLFGIYCLGSTCKFCCKECCEASQTSSEEPTQVSPSQPPAFIPAFMPSAPPPAQFGDPPPYSEVRALALLLVTQQVFSILHSENHSSNLVKTNG